MATISPAQVSDGTGIDASDVNNPINTIANEFNGNIDNSNIKSAAAIDGSKLAGGVTGMFGAWSSWTPTWANLTIGNATVTAKYIQLGKTVHFKVQLVWGSTSVMGSIPTFTLPATSVSYAGTATTQPIGLIKIFDTSVPTTYAGALFWASTTTLTPQIYAVASSNISFSGIAAGTPIAFATGDELSFLGSYEAA